MARWSTTREHTRSDFIPVIAQTGHSLQFVGHLAQTECAKGRSPRQRRGSYENDPQPQRESPLLSLVEGLRPFTRHSDNAGLYARQCMGLSLESAAI